METKVSISNVLHIQEAEVRLESGKITVISGPNASGKTSTALIVGALLTGAENPLGVGKGQGKVYLRDGADAGFADLTVDGEIMRRWTAETDEFVEYPAANPPVVSHGAAGLVDFTASMTAPVRAAMWEGYFLPPNEELHALIAKQLEGLVAPVVFEEIMDLIQHGKLDDIVKAYADRARTAKAEWMAVTGETWGKAKAADWIPDGWLSELDGETGDSMEMKVQEARDDVALLQRERAVTAAEIERAVEAKEKIAALFESLADAKATYAEMDRLYDAFKADARPLYEALTEARGELAVVESREPADEQAMACPGCAAPLIVTDDGLVVHDAKAAAAQKEKWESDLDAAKQEVEERNVKLSKHYEELSVRGQEKKPVADEMRKIEAEIAALRPLAVDADAVAVDADAAERIDAGERAIEDLIERRRMVLAREAAQIHHRNILDYTEVVLQLGPKGVRATALAKEMDRLDKALSTISDITAWPRVAVDKSYSVSVGERKVLRVCAESELLRAQYMLQIALVRSRMEGYVILDKADHLDQLNMDALFTLLRTLAGRPGAPAILVCGTDIAGKNLNADGFNYTLRDGVAAAT